MAYVFVGGSQRTGTSIAQQMLCQLPGANPYLYEASFLRQLVTVYADARNNFNANYSSYFGDLQNLRNFNSGVVHAFLENTAQCVGSVQHLILKEPHLTVVWPYLFELVPEAMFLMLVRDPHDAIASMVQVGEKQKQAGQNYLFVKRDIRGLCQHFLSFYQPAFDVKDEKFRSQLAVVHYEELVGDASQTMRDIALFTGLPFDQIDLNTRPDDGYVKQEHTTASPLYSPWVTEVSGKAVSRSRVGNYRNVLTEKDIAIINQECAEFIGWFGYSRKAA